MRLLTHVLASFLVTLLLGVLWRVLPFEVVAPAAAVVFAAYLGTSGRERMPLTVGAAIVIGYLADLLAGTPRGLTALVAGAICIAARLVSSRLLVRGRLVVAGFGFAVAMAAALIAALAEALLGGRVGDPIGSSLVAIGSASLTALVAPPIFWFCRLIDAAFARTARERDALREGYLS